MVPEPEEATDTNWSTLILSKHQDTVLQSVGNRALAQVAQKVVGSPPGKSSKAAFIWAICSKEFCLSRAMGPDDVQSLLQP